MPLVLTTKEGQINKNDSKRSCKEVQALKENIAPDQKLFSHIVTQQETRKAHTFVPPQRSGFETL